MFGLLEKIIRNFLGISEDQNDDGAPMVVTVGPDNEITMYEDWSCISNK